MWLFSFHVMVCGLISNKISNLSWIMNKYLEMYEKLHFILNKVKSSLDHHKILWEIWEDLICNKRCSKSFRSHVYFIQQDIELNLIYLYLYLIEYIYIHRYLILYKESSTNHVDSLGEFSKWPLSRRWSKIPENLTKWLVYGWPLTRNQA